MSKVAPPKYGLTLDDEIEVSRIGALEKPGNHITDYVVNRGVCKPTIVTVTFIADDQFCKRIDELYDPAT